MRYIWCFLLFLTVSMSAQVQNDFWDHVRYGGGIGLSFGTESFQIALAPSAIYQVNNYVALGVGLNYTYSKFFDSRFSAYGGSLIGLVNPLPQVQLSAEFEQLRVNRSPVPEFERGTYWLPALYLGAGFRNGPVTFGIRYDVLYDSTRSLYSNPWLPFVRVYF
jgi:hypothetical protein